MFWQHQHFVGDAEMPRIGKKWLFLLLFFGCIIHESRGLSEDHPLLLDRFLHVIWEPSGLVRLWIAADQLLNIVSSWGGVARTLVTLPFKEARDERSHVMIKGYNGPGSRLGGESISSHRERFAKAYSDPPEFTFTDQNILLAGKGHNYVAASGSANFPRAAFPTGVLNEDYFGMPSVFKAGFPLLGKEPPATSSQPGDLFILQKPPLSELLKNTKNVASLGNPYWQLLWPNKYAEENALLKGHLGGATNAPHEISKVLAHFLNSLSKTNAMQDVFAPQHSSNFPFLVNTDSSVFYQMDSLNKGNYASSLNSVDRHHRNSKIRKIEGSLESSRNQLLHSPYYQEIQSPLNVAESLFVSTDPQIRLQMALRLLKELGPSHVNNMETLEYGEK